MIGCERMVKQDGTVQRKSPGFTLIELLVVVAIIAVLAAILFPVFARARDNARRTSCISNLKQIGLGVMMYVQDYDGRFPLAVYGVPPGTKGPDNEIFWDGTVFWEQSVYPYVKSHQMYFCPSTPNALDAPDDGSGHSLSHILNGNYSANELIVLSGDSGAESTSLLAAIPTPSSTYLFLEFGFYLFQPYYVANPIGSYYVPGAGDAGVTCSSTVFWPSDCKSGRHFGGVTVGYADGHVKWLSTDVILKQAKQFLIGPPANKGVSAFNPLTDNS